VSKKPRYTIIRDITVNKNYYDNYNVIGLCGEIIGLNCQLVYKFQNISELYIFIINNMMKITSKVGGVLTPFIFNQLHNLDQLSSNFKKSLCGALIQLKQLDFGILAIQIPTKNALYII
jgi:hypothetical protein